MTTERPRAGSPIPWRRGALTVGGLATAAWATLLVLTATEDTPSVLANVASWIALVLSFGTTYLLTRMWSHEVYAESGQAVLGRRLSAAFEILVAVIIVLALVGVGVPLQLVLVYTAVACFFGALVLALPRPTSG
jgi:putative flippase GtrA